MIYLDSAAIVKLVHAEAESDALRAWLDERADTGWISSVLAEIESFRALARHAPEAAARLPAVLDQIELIGLKSPIRMLAQTVRPVTVRSLDAIHLGTALHTRHVLTSFVTYDKRLLDAALAADREPGDVGRGLLGWELLSGRGKTGPESPQVAAMIVVQSTGIRLASREEEHLSRLNLVRAAEQSVQGSRDRGSETTVLGKGLGGHQNQARVRLPGRAVAAVQGYEVFDVGRYQCSSFRCRVGEHVIVRERHQSGIGDDRDDIVALGAELLSDTV
jgi:hypothetical protein